MMFRICLLFLFFVTLVLSEEESSARLLAHKHIMNRFLVEGRDVIVDYTIYNVGGSAALGIHLVDLNFPEEHFEVVSGLLKMKLDRLGPGANISHTVVVRPRTFGHFNFTAAEVTYLPYEGAQEVQIGYTSEPGEGGIFALKDFDRRFSPHLLDWAAFVVMTLPSLGIPFLLWFNSKSKYEEIVRQSKKH